MGWRGGFYEYAEEVRRRSLRLGIPSIDFEDAMAIYSGALVAVAGRSGAVLVDAGAGIGYSTLWLAKAAEDGCGGRCRVVAVEWLGRFASLAREVLSAPSWERVEVEVVEGDALEYLRGLPDSSVTVAFVDVEKDQYPEAARVLFTRKLEPGGVAFFHNAFFPPPPPGFRGLLEELGALVGVAPTPAGLYVAVKPRRARPGVGG